MSLEFFLEADSGLTLPILEQVLIKAGAEEIWWEEGLLKAYFTSGISVCAEERSKDFTIYAEDAKGMDFRVAVFCNFRMKGPEPEGYSSMDDLDKVAQGIAQACSAFFVISFQFETTMYWRDAAGLHGQSTQS
ncbi:hypothetical protein NLK61_24765 [Pseudomonas fuscovaginae UPB0736]|uniref:hypothetical protein n=1 Tax=Pseudomonas asplenii TaxID=53407 RepID=UPI00028958EF|nr:hypothetical protein [Pseudomonas fuscovaginae]UUQ64391.1 hypothetical protein NLK61_24765 [Pseudomonas fuscovaginae UPB0736]